MKRTENGSAIIYILIAIALIAALTYYVTQGSRTGSSSISKEQASLAATEIIEYMQLLADTTQKLLLRGCSETEISFHTPIIGHLWWDNPNSPSDNSCHIYDANGGNVNFRYVDEIYKDQSYGGFGPYQEYFFVARDMGVSNVGPTSDTGDLVVSIWGIKEEICIEINNQLGITNPSGTPPVDTNAAPNNAFIGNYTSTFGNLMANTGTSLTHLSGRTSGCLGIPTDMAVYQVLIAR